MADWLLWAVAIGLAVVAGWAWSSWRQRSTRKPARPSGGSSRPGRAPRHATRPGPPPRPGPAAPTGRPPRRRVPPRPGEIWWADVPYADGTGSKVRPCLVLRSDRRGVDVLKITSQDKSDRDDHVRIATRGWDADADHDSYLDVSDPIRVAATAFEDRAGSCDPQLWRQVRKLAHLQTS
ncbi:type II toxin-antitoxin system PemK/MazF family toxin [Micromonospora sp. ATA32]|nr:type II toxin-antitoxin system PemK/MazF family toxin [Micromonospora sp. ATA32]